MVYGKGINMSTFEISRAAPQDALKILDYCKAVGAETDCLTFGQEGVSFTAEKEAEYLKSIEHSNTQLYLVAKQEGEIIATAVYTGFLKPRLAHRGEISISVRKAMWGNHVGSQLMEKLIDFAQNTAGAEIISLEVRSDNERAIALYRKFGFQKIGCFKGYLKINGTYIDCDIMNLYLKPPKMGVSLRAHL